MGQHQRGPVDRLDDIGHGKGLAGACHTQQDLLGKTGVQAMDQRINGPGLVAHRLVRRVQFKIHVVPSSGEKRFGRHLV